MSMQNIKQTAEDQYLDLIIRLAYEQIADQEVEKLLNEPDPELTNEEKTTADKAFQDVLSEEDTRRKHEKRRQSTKNFRHMLVKVCEVAACLIIIIGIAFPIAIATSAQFRSKVMHLLMEIDSTKQEAHFHFVEDEKAAFYVPDDWEGEWYPAYIPSDMKLTGIEHIFLRSEYRNDSDAIFWFYELGNEANAMIGIEDANIETIDINGSKAWLLYDESDKHRITVVWSTDDKWFKIDSSLVTKEDILAIAKSVKRIIR